MNSHTFLALVLVASGCTPLEDGPLIAVDAWEEISASEDPAADRPDSVSCPVGAWFWEDLAGEDSVEIDTGLCSYLALGQPSLTEVQQGDTLHLRLWHLALYSDVEGEAHVALFLDDVLLWEDSVPIPSEAGMIRPEIHVEFDADEGSPVVFHLHNHGFNTWNFLGIDVTRE